MALLFLLLLFLLCLCLYKDEVLAVTVVHVCRFYESRGDALTASGADPPSSPPTSRPSFVGLADSFAFNPHKMLGLRSRGQHSLFGIVAR